jgi:hypothetical protein
MANAEIAASILTGGKSVEEVRCEIRVCARDQTVGIRAPTDSSQSAENAEEHLGDWPVRFVVDLDREFKPFADAFDPVADAHVHGLVLVAKLLVDARDPGCIALNTRDDLVSAVEVATFALREREENPKALPESRIANEVDPRTVPREAAHVAASLIEPKRAMC